MELASCYLFSISNMRCLPDFWTICAFLQHDASDIIFVPCGMCIKGMWNAVS